MSGSTVEGVIVAVLGLIGAVLVARISTPRERPAPVAPGVGDSAGELPPPGLQVSPEIWDYVSSRFATLEEKVDNLTVLVETKKAEVSALERLLQQAMRIIRRTNRRLVAVHEAPEEIPRELIPYSIE
ncbi:hypothetical protein ACN24M_24740 [Streptomyces microflavus]|uniref:hypothetical protein n=1 Tax=Streptomyces microflavus TaxID=1919 RepID=UPI003B21FAF4